MGARRLFLWFWEVFPFFEGRWANMYWDKTSSVPSTMKLDANILRYLRQNDRILDMGCGAGRTLAELTAGGFLGTKTGVDRNVPSLMLARERGLPVVRADLAALPFVGASFDVGILHAVLTTVIPHAARLTVLAEARRVVGRVLCIADFLENRDLPYYLARYEAGVAETGEQGSFVVREGGEVLYTAHHFTLDELSTLLGDAGFRVVYTNTPRVRTRSGNVVRGVVLAAEAF
jgi:SAM-dependent methyltransferase